jgi:hypothetical protein
MFYLISAVLLFVTAIPAVADAQENCRAIKDAKARLECFDKGVPVPSPKAQPGLDATTVRKSPDSVTDKVTCVILAGERPYIQFNRGRGEVQGYQYRIDDHPGSAMQLPSSIEKGVSLINSRHRVSALTLVSGIMVDRECPK